MAQQPGRVSHGAEPLPAGLVPPRPRARGSRRGAVAQKRVYSGRPVLHDAQPADERQAPPVIPAHRPFQGGQSGRAPSQIQGHVPQVRHFRAQVPLAQLRRCRTQDRVSPVPVILHHIPAADLVSDGVRECHRPKGTLGEQPFDHAHDNRERPVPAAAHARLGHPCQQADIPGRQVQRPPSDLRKPISAKQVLVLPASGQPLRQREQQAAPLLGRHPCEPVREGLIPVPSSSPRRSLCPRSLAGTSVLIAFGDRGREQLAVFAHQVTQNHPAISQPRRGELIKPTRVIATITHGRS